MLRQTPPKIRQSARRVVALTTSFTPIAAKPRDSRLDATEADRVRTIFRGYLKPGSLNLLMADPRKRGIVTKIRKLKTGERVGGIAFTRGSLAQLLRNRFSVSSREPLSGSPAFVFRDSGARSVRKHGRHWWRLSPETSLA